MSEDLIGQLYKIEKKRKRVKQIPMETGGHVIDDSKARYQIRSRQYCGLSREAKWQAWLGEKAPDLLDDLRTYLLGKVSCKSNTEKMKTIQSKLFERGLLRELVVFLLDNYPNIIIKLDAPNSK